jgi:hypothetical protein
MANILLQNEYNIRNVINYSYIENNINNINTDDLAVHIYVKFVYQTTNATYTLSRNLSLTEMVRRLQENILRDFGVAATQYELVEAGQDTPPGIPAEEAPALIVSSRTIRRRFNDQNCVALYIRMFPPTASSSLSSESTILTVDPCCMVCQEAPTTLTAYFGCSHHICDACCSGCIQAGITRCAICRHPR